MSGAAQIAPAPAAQITLHLPAQLPPLSRGLVALGLMLARWDHRRRSRKAMRWLDDRLLEDIGLTRREQDNEVQKPFWRN